MRELTASEVQTAREAILATITDRTLTHEQKVTNL